jgi:hypothetical protein
MSGSYLQRGQRCCLICGMQHSYSPGSIVDRDSEPLCSKCDSPLWSCSDGSIETDDIAHQRETVVEALEKCRAALDRVWQHSHAEYLRLIVGGGRIGDAVQAELHYLQSQGTILDYRQENRGAVLIRVRN